MSPLCESYLSADQLNQMEEFYPLHVYVCSNCFLVQLQEYVSPEKIFSEYAYFSSYSDSWLAHAKTYTDEVVERFGLNAETLVVEIGSNDGYLLQYFAGKAIQVLGIEPALNIADVALKKGIPTMPLFFGAQVAGELVAMGKQADLLVVNNVLAQVVDLNGFVAGMKKLLKPHGVVTIEFPHLMRLVERNQFDTIYHEHFSYFSFGVAEKILASHGLTGFDVEELTTHGGSLRIYACNTEDRSKPLNPRVHEIRAREEFAGCSRLDYYLSFSAQVNETKHKLLEFLIHMRRARKNIVGYGAPGKGNTLLNYCGIREDFLDYTVDRNPYKQGKFLPGTHIPIYHPDHIKRTRPDYLLILPWNLRDEIIDQMAYIRQWGGQFLIPIPGVAVCP
jgi:SAM-dependent methyltransferase